MDKSDFGCIIGLFIGLGGVKLNLIDITTWGSIFEYIILFSIVIYFLNKIYNNLSKSR